MTGAQYRRYRLTLPSDRYDEAVGLLLDLGVQGWEEDVDLEAAGTILEPVSAWAAADDASRPPGDGAVAVGVERTVAAGIDRAAAGVRRDVTHRSDVRRERTLTFWLAEGLAAAPADAAVGHEGREGALARLADLGRLETQDQASGWETRWREFHRPVTVAGVTVRAPWHDSPAGGIDLVIDPGMAFGTGGHATTRQCLAALDGLERGSLLDLGAGSGVLALAGVLLGFDPVWAVEIDPDAAASAQENAGRNGLSLTVTVADCCDPAVALPAADVVVANVALGPIMRLGARYSLRDAGAAAARPRPPRAIVLAGLLEDQVAAAEAAFGGYRRRRLDVQEGWAMLVLEAERS